MVINIDGAQESTERFNEMNVLRIASMYSSLSQPEKLKISIFLLINR